MIASKCNQCIISKINALKALSKSELKSISNSKTTLIIKKGEAIFNEGEKLNGVYCIRRGVVKLSKLGTNGKDQVIKIELEGNVLGLRSVITDEFTNLSAVALNEMEICFIPKTELVNKLGNKAFSLNILKEISNSLKQSENKIANLVSKNSLQRTAELLLTLNDNISKTENGFIDLKLSRKDMANVIGIAEEACIRILSNLKKNGVITTQSKHIKINDEEHLKQISEGLLVK